MADLLLELFCEEIPARMQAQAAKDLERLVVGALTDRGLLFEGANAFYGPRRLTLVLAGLPVKQPDVSEEIKGPKVDAPAAAIAGFLKKTGLTQEQLQVQDSGKGKVYIAKIDRKGRATADVLAEVLPECLAKLPWPKSMRWPQTSNAPMRWVRPLHSILCTLDGEIVPFHFAGVGSSDRTRGHRFLSSGPITARRYDDYVKKLREAHVVLDAEERKAIIFEGIKSAAFVRGLELIPDEGLLDEVAGLAEWPVVLIGAIEDQFMDVPPEILQTSMRVHQKYFALRDPATGKMANQFALVANMVAEDGGKQIVAGNERVLRARLSDAKFFWDQDRKTRLEDRVNALGSIVFHAKLGTQLERVERIEALAEKIALTIKTDFEKAKRAAYLCKADLTTGVVGEFPELQGVMGRYYHLQHHPDDVEVADAIRDHYKPLGPSDAVPKNKVSISVALADKFDLLVQFFSVGERPTGSGDPFALRRAALGAIRTILSNELELPIDVIFGLIAPGDDEAKRRALVEDLLLFVVDRFKVGLREYGIRHDIVDAVFSRWPDEFARGSKFDLVRLFRRAQAIDGFLSLGDGASLMSGYRRAANILKIEEKKSGRAFDGEPEHSLLVQPEEQLLVASLSQFLPIARQSILQGTFATAVAELSKLRRPIDSFFDAVKVNDERTDLRANRLKLLSRIVQTFHEIADFSKIEG